MKKKLKNNILLIIVYSAITFCLSSIIIFNIDSFNETVRLEEFYSKESISFEISGDYSSTLSKEDIKKIFSNDSNFMILKKEIRNNLSGIYISGDYQKYLDISKGESLINKKYRNKPVATRGKAFWKYDDIKNKEYINVYETNYEIVGIHNFENISWYEHRGIINFVDDYLYSDKFLIAGEYIIDGEDAVYKFNQIKGIIENNTENLSVIRHNNTKLNEILLYISDMLPIFIFMACICCIFILNMVNITRNWFLDKVKVLGVMRVFGATKKEIAIFSIKSYLKQTFIGFIFGYLLFGMRLCITGKIIDYSLGVVFISPAIVLIVISMISMISIFISMHKILKLSPLGVMKFYGK
ncbi:MAG: FtsX-like permease family protein [Sarcina sp.]